MIEFDFVSLEDVFDEVHSYLQAQSDVVKKANGEDLNLDLSTYRVAAETGQLMTLTLRHNGKMVGFSLFHISPDLRDRSIYEATNHGIVLNREYRKKYGKRMFTEAHKFLKRAGVSETMYINDKQAFGRYLSKNFKAQPKYTVWGITNG